MLAAVLAAFSWGTATVLSKAALAEVSPLVLLFLQLAASVTVLWFVVWLRNIPPGDRTGARRHAWLGLLEPGIAHLFGLIGLKYMNASGATLIQSSESIMIVILSAIIMRVWPSWRLLGLSTLAMLGVVIALDLVNPNSLSGNSFFGLGLMFAAIATAAVYVLLTSRIASRCDPILAVAWQQSLALVFAALVLVGVGLGTKHAIDFSFPLPVWLVVCVSGVVQYAVAFSLYMFALRSVSANVAGTFLNLTPIFGIIGAILFLGEGFSFAQGVGSAVTIGSVLMITYGEEY